MHEAERVDGHGELLAHNAREFVERVDVDGRSVEVRDHEVDVRTRRALVGHAVLKGHRGHHHALPRQPLVFGELERDLEWTTHAL